MQRFLGLRNERNEGQLVRSLSSPLPPSPVVWAGITMSKASLIHARSMGSCCSGGMYTAWLAMARAKEAMRGREERRGLGELENEGQLRLLPFLVFVYSPQQREVRQSMEI